MLIEDAPPGWRHLMREALRRDRKTRWPGPRVLLIETLGVLLLTVAAIARGTHASLGEQSVVSSPLAPPPAFDPSAPFCPSQFDVPSMPVPLEARDYLLLVLTTLPLAARRRYPLAVYWVVLVAAVSAQAYTGFATSVGLVVAAWSAIRYSPNLPSALGSFLLGALVAASGQGATPGLPVDPTRPAVWINLGALVVGAVHYYRRAVRENARRLAELEREQAEATARALEEERARIAAELHDVVTHNVGMMVIQAGAGRRVLDSSPEQTREALLAVEAAGRAAMAELRHVMGLLAASASGEAAAGGEPELEPQPGLDQLEHLVARVRAAGLPVELALALPAEPLPAGADLTAYRVVQEALTNVMKHAVGASATVSVAPDGDFLEIEVVNTAGTPGPQAATGGGRGLLGMRERLALYGGELDARRRIGGGYLVKARLRWRAG
ncbi:sensor histidine kinase [Kitasatospora viridis]|uniref:sensor histidine kinase n=1 Tax=Kitasatospora viridis TaxID=281105 RepID=UPI001BA86B33|nr:histidine kinase [Kitasatospora viridis]